jgi:hypothetical protein
MAGDWAGVCWAPLSVCLSSIAVDARSRTRDGHAVSMTAKTEEVVGRRGIDQTETRVEGHQHDIASRSGSPVPRAKESPRIPHHLLADAPNSAPSQNDGWLAYSAPQAHLHLSNLVEVAQLCDRAQPKSGRVGASAGTAGRTDGRPRSKSSAKFGWREAERGDGQKSMQSAPARWAVSVAKEWSETGLVVSRGPTATRHQAPEKKGPSGWTGLRQLDT